MTKNKTITEKSSLVSLNNPKALATFANDLKDFVVKNKLYTPIVSKKKQQDGSYITETKNFVNVEGWQFAGASMGIFPKIVDEERIVEDGKVTCQSYGKNQEAPIYKYKVTVELEQISTGKVVGRAVALCSNQESKKKTFDEFAVLSMAQTRATGKAFRITLGWIMKLAGYEATPAEEVAEDEPESEPVTQTELPIEDIKLLVNAKLAAMSAPDKIKLLKDYVNTVTDKNLSDDQYKRLYSVLSTKSEV